MGRRGPVQTPTRILSLRGSWRAKDRPGEPQPRAAAPGKPASLTPAAAVLWDELAPALAAAGVLTQIDRHLLARYCELHVQWDQLHDFIGKAGQAHPVKNHRGEIVDVGLYPQFHAMLKVNEALLRMAQHLGLSPAARAGIKGHATQAASPTFDFFSPRGVG